MKRGGVRWYVFSRPDKKRPVYASKKEGLVFTKPSLYSLYFVESL